MRGHDLSDWSVPLDGEYFAVSRIAATYYPDDLGNGWLPKV